MEKTKIDLTAIKDETIRFGKTKIEVKPIISTNTTYVIMDACLRQFASNVGDSRFINYGLIRSIFDIIVLYKQTNIQFDFIKDDGNSVVLELTDDILAQYENCGIINIVTSHIVNYIQIWESVKEGICLYNTNSALSKLAQIPSVDEMKSAIGGLTDFAKQNPDLIKTAIADSRRMEAINGVTQALRNEIKEEKAKNAKTKKKKQ